MLVYGGQTPASFCRCLRQPEHRILQQLRSRGDDVFVVTEVLQTEEEVQITKTYSREGSGQFAVPGAFLKVCASLSPSLSSLEHIEMAEI